MRIGTSDNILIQLNAFEVPEFLALRAFLRPTVIRQKIAFDHSLTNYPVPIYIKNFPTCQVHVKAGHDI